MRFFTDMIVTAEDAREAGLTHHGKLFGVPAWVRVDEQSDQVFGVPKFQPLRFWCDFADMCFQLAATLLCKPGQCLATPLRVGRPI